MATKSLQVPLDEIQLHRFRVACVMRGQTMSSVIREYVAKYIESTRLTVQDGAK